MHDTTTRSRSTLTWLLAPATEGVPGRQAIGPTVLRVLLGLMWLYNVSWKRPPDFGQDHHSGLYKYTADAVSHPVLPPYSWLVDHVVLHVFVPFGWLVLVTETALAVLLLTGTWVRLAAVIGIAQSLAIGLSVAYAPGEWPWSYWLMIGAHVALLTSSAGRLFALDRTRAGLGPARTVATFWGGLAVVLGIIGVVGSLGDPLSARGSGLSSSALSIGLGRYNLLGGLVLVVAGGLLVLAARGGPSWAASGAAALGLLAALSIDLQTAFGDPLLGGSPTSAAVFLVVSLTAAVVARSSHGPGPSAGSSSPV